jgi:hypothetical protein
LGFLFPIHIFMGFFIFPFFICHHTFSGTFPFLSILNMEFSYVLFIPMSYVFPFIFFIITRLLFVLRQVFFVKRQNIMNLIMLSNFVWLLFFVTELLLSHYSIPSLVLWQLYTIYILPITHKGFQLDKFILNFII